MPLLLNDLGPCPVCAAAVPVTGPLYRHHLEWHRATGTHLDSSGRLFTAAGSPGDDDAPTVQFPPLRETTFRRPPPPAVRELRGAELLRALAEAMDEDEDLDDEDPS